MLLSKSRSLDFACLLEKPHYSVYPVQSINCNAFKVLSNLFWCFGTDFMIGKMECRNRTLVVATEVQFVFAGVLCAGEHAWHESGTCAPGFETTECATYACAQPSKICYGWGKHPAGWKRGAYIHGSTLQGNSWQRGIQHAEHCMELPSCPSRLW